MTFVLALACFAGSFAGTMAGSRTAVLTGRTTAVASVLTASTSAARAPAESIGNQMLDWAEAHETGRPYVYGATGPYGYDCSGAVYAAALRVLAADGFRMTWPRDTYELESAVYSGRYKLEVIPVSKAERGDLLIWPGWAHVEFKTDFRDGSFGAETTGTDVGWHTWNSYWEPVLAIRILYT